jgi:hypothetical protein
LAFIIKRFPVPEDHVPWEDIIAFREDSENRQRLVALRRWATKMAKTDSAARELDEELEYLLQEYQRALKLTRIKFRLDRLELAFVTPIEILENFLKLKWSTAAKKLFEMRRNKVDFLLREHELPGTEVAYINNVRESFPSKEERPIQ